MVTKEELFSHIQEIYGAKPEYLWTRTPNYAVFRHKESRKWFAASIDVQPRMLGLPGEGALDALLLKCDPPLIELLAGSPGIFSGYHMDKKHWITVLTDSKISKEEVFKLLAMSFELTQGKEDKLEK